MKRKTKPKPRRVSRKPRYPLKHRVTRPRKPAPVPALPPETANLPAVRTADMVPADTAPVKELVAQNFYEIAAGIRKVSIPEMALMGKLPAETALRWISFCPTPKRFRWWRPGPGADCERGVTCRTCQRFDNCGRRLEYVPGSFMKLCVNTMFPGRWSLDGVTVERSKTEDGLDQFIASGYLVLTHADGHVQRIYQSGECAIQKRVPAGHFRKGAITDLIKKALAEVGFCADVYSGLGMHEDIPPETGDKPAPPTPDARKVWAALFRDVDKRLKGDARSVHKSGYTPRLKWEDAANLWPEFGESQAPFTTDDEAVECFAALPVDSRKALYAKIRYKWIRSDKALMDAKYGKTEAPDDYRPDDARPRTPVQQAADPSGTRKPKMGSTAEFKLWCQKTLGVRSWRDAEPEVNRVVRLYAERAKRSDLTDWLDLTPVDAQNLRALLQEEAAKGGKS